MKTTLLFPGQGAQKVGMGADVYQAYPEARQVFDQADEVLGFSLSKLCFDGPEDVLTDTANAQPAILVTSLAAYKALGARVPVADCMAGHSLGEYSALVASGALALRDAISLTRERGQWMKRAGERTPGGMVAILNLEDAVLEDVCTRAARDTGGVVQIANYNSPGQIVISGDQVTLDRAVELAKERGARRVIPLAVSVATHSPLMAYASDGLRKALHQVTFSDPQVPVIANVTGQALSSAAGVEHELVSQLTSPVRWTASVQEMLSRGVQRFIEIGPGTVLTGLVRRMDKAVEIVNLNDASSLRVFLEGA